MNVQFVLDALDWVTKNKDWISILIAIISVVVSIIALNKSRKAQKEQLKLERITAKLSQQQIDQTNRIKSTTLALFLNELIGHLASLSRTLDHINPIWMHRGAQGVFDNREISHSNLHVICYEKYISGIESVDTRLKLNAYYQGVLEFNANGDEISGSEIRNALTVNYFVRGADMLIRTGIELSDELIEMIGADFLESEQIRRSVENLENQRKYYITICNASRLDCASLGKIIQEYRNNSHDKEEFERKYPAKGYISGLWEAASNS
ncbi:hypothetical protein [Pseudoalteromonas sp. BDTF-M6]|uniref:hypothetical protein n=1 Tax=Pseudoalteromonas sp. BDTF-M6 TaxID=2796132 RepID=UPI001BB0CB9A|nr:hypothetical protein [Pseudoalteromonas sp. BDTF-M6]MBS3796528.1 hypothetical protein [Pseudoalteromonas sp. BDTF-M6]